MRRLEDQGLLTSEWDTTESRPRKVYRTSRDGDQLLAA
ncbi:MAG: PadR family transcriptional regulator, partial [Microbacterium sp.]